MNTAKPFAIPKQLAFDAWKAVKANAGSSGVDTGTIADFETDLKTDLDRLCNRMWSGNDFPPPVKAVITP
jgi:retron-type reverse transcriptase